MPTMVCSQSSSRQHLRPSICLALCYRMHTSEHVLPAYTGVEYCYIPLLHCLTPLFTSAYRSNDDSPTWIPCGISDTFWSKVFISRIITALHSVIQMKLYGVKEGEYFAQQCQWTVGGHPIMNASNWGYETIMGDREDIIFWGIDPNI